MLTTKLSNLLTCKVNTVPPQLEVIIHLKYVANPVSNTSNFFDSLVNMPQTSHSQHHFFFHTKGVLEINTVPEAKPQHFGSHCINLLLSSAIRVQVVIKKASSVRSGGWGHF